VQRGRELLERIEEEARRYVSHATMFTHLEDPVSFENVRLEACAERSSDGRRKWRSAPHGTDRSPAWTTGCELAIFCNRWDIPLAPWTTDDESIW
jgi:hypothetical protein